MVYLPDTGVAGRCVLPADPQYPVIRAAVLRLLAGGDKLTVGVQVLSEAWCLFTRPAESRGGYGLSTSDADEAIADLLALASLVPGPPNLWQEQHRLLVSCRVSGSTTHDCRLAAWCRLSGIDGLITLNPDDFDRFGVPTVQPGDV